jgi:TonB family protein
MNENRNRSGRILLISCMLTLLLFPLGYFFLGQQADWPEVKTIVRNKAEFTNDLTLLPPPPEIPLIPPPSDPTETEIAKINRAGTSRTAMLVSVPDVQDNQQKITYSDEGLICAAEFYLHDNAPTGGYNPAELDELPEILNLEEIKNCLYYPESCKMDEIRGRVILQVLIGKSGEIEGMEVKKSPDPRLSEVVLECMKKAKGKAGTMNGKPVKSWALIPFLFQIER